MGRNGSSPVNQGSNLSNREMPTTPLRYTREIGWGRAEDRSGRTIAAACHTMAGTAIAHKILLPRTHRRPRNGQWLLCCRQRHAEEYPPQDYPTKTIPLHALSPLCTGKDLTHSRPAFLPSALP
jgi:transposase InsO family protein